jgi:hypothetical protein
MQLVDVRMVVCKDVFVVLCVVMDCGCCETCQEPW